MWFYLKMGESKKSPAYILLHWYSVSQSIYILSEHTHKRVVSVTEHTRTCMRRLGNIGLYSRVIIQQVNIYRHNQHTRRQNCDEYSLRVNLSIFDKRLSWKLFDIQIFLELDSNIIAWQNFVRPLRAEPVYFDTIYYLFKIYLFVI